MLDVFEEWQQLNQLFEEEQKQLLVEAPLSNGSSLIQHMERHVLQPGESYDPINPKFTSHMSQEDYVDAAIELAKTEVFGTSDMK